MINDVDNTGIVVTNDGCFSSLLKNINELIIREKLNKYGLSF